MAGHRITLSVQEKRRVSKMLDKRSGQWRGPVQAYLYKGRPSNHPLVGGAYAVGLEEGWLPDLA